MRPLPMSGMNDIVPNQLSDRRLNNASSDDAPGGFAWLSRNRQVLVFQTIEDALSASPPRQDATFENVVAAYKAVTNTVIAANSGLFCDAVLAQLEHSIRAAGGQIAPGLRSQGERSVAAFRAASFGEIGNRYDPVVVDSIQRSLAVYLQSLDIDDLGQVFDAVASFLNPILNGEDNPSVYAIFQQFDNLTKANVFLTIEDAFLSSPQRHEATFDTVVSAFAAEKQLIQSSKDGEFSENILKRYESSISLAGGKLYPGTMSHGDASIYSYRKQVFGAVNTVLSDDVRSVAESCLNTVLRRLKIGDPVELLRAVKSFYDPLIPGCWDSPSVKVFNGLSESRKVLVFKTLELVAACSGEYGQSAFQKAVKSATAELAVLEAASFGQLNADVLGDLLDTIVECGGSIAGGLSAYGPGTVGELLDVFYVYAVKTLPQEVFLAANSALNARLRTLSPTSVLDVLAAAKAFVMPLVSTLKQSDSTLPHAECPAIEVSDPESLKHSQLSGDEVTSDPVASSGQHLHLLERPNLTAVSTSKHSLSLSDSLPDGQSTVAVSDHSGQEQSVARADIQEFSAERADNVDELPVHLEQPDAHLEHAVSDDTSESLSVSLIAGEQEDGSADDKKKALFP